MSLDEDDMLAFLLLLILHSAQCKVLYILLYCCVRFRLLYSYSWPLPHPFLINIVNRPDALLPYSNMFLLVAPWSIIFVTNVHIHVGHMHIVHGHAAWTCSMNMQQVPAACTCIMDLWTWSVVTWTCSMDMQHAYIKEILGVVAMVGSENTWFNFTEFDFWNFEFFYGIKISRGLKFREISLTALTRTQRQPN